MKTWFITGATRGLGLETARAALAAGDNVVATGRDPAKLAGTLTDPADRLLVLPLDVTEDAAVERAVAAAVEKFGRIDVLVNNAGYGQLGFFEEVSQAAAERQFETNVFGVFRVTRAVLPVMRRQGAGHVITISSMVGLVGTDGGGVYSASKFAVAGWSDSLSIELKRFGLRATAVYPGYFRTDFLDASSMQLADLSVEQYRPLTEKATARRASVNHRQAGDPVAFGKAMVTLAGMAEPPAHLAVGSDAAKVMSDKGAALQAGSAAQHALSASTDFPEGA